MAFGSWALRVNSARPHAHRRAQVHFVCDVVASKMAGILAAGLENKFKLTSKISTGGQGGWVGGGGQGGWLFGWVGGWVGGGAGR